MNTSASLKSFKDSFITKTSAPAAAFDERIQCRVEIKVRALKGVANQINKPIGPAILSICRGPLKSESNPITLTSQTPSANLALSLSMTTQFLRTSQQVY